MNMFDLTGKKAIVTGAHHGLGKGMAEALHEAGAEVVIIDIADGIMETAREIGAEGPEVHGIKGDLGNRENLKKCFDRSVEKLDGKLDILINNAGIQRRSKSEDFPIEYWDDVIEINLTSIFQLCKLAGNLMFEQGKGKIINMASMLSYFGGYTVPAYAASKGGVAQLTKALSNEWAAKGINVNALAPGYMATIMNDALVGNPDREPQILDRIPADRWGSPEDVKGIAVFLASEASDYITGAVIPVDGGFLAR